MKKLWVVTLTTALLLAQPLAEAKRLGGGGSIGRQSSNVTQRQATPPAAPARQQNAQQQPAQNPGQANAAQTPAKKPWGAMLGGLAAGLGLAWLANSLGLGEAFGNILLIGLLVMAGLAIFGMIRRRNQNAAAAPAPFAFQGGPAPAAAGGNVFNPPQYKPEKVGNDASARPWEQFGQAAPASSTAGGSMIGAALAGSQTWGIPADFDTAGFITAAKRNYLNLQSAWDAGDLDTLRSMMTDDMLEEVRQQLAEREAEANGTANVTEIEGLEAQLLGIEDQGDVYLASVEFSGMSREDLGAGLSPFREVWNMAKPKSGSGGWLVAGLQSLG
ncbi:MAG: 39S ribosomal protein L45 [Comamonas sp.]|nr:39S ribosomal protein L45 [Comamonas sp.]